MLKMVVKKEDMQRDRGGCRDRMKADDVLE